MYHFLHKTAPFYKVHDVTPPHNLLHCMICACTMLLLFMCDIEKHYTIIEKILDTVDVPSYKCVLVSFFIGCIFFVSKLVSTNSKGIY